MGLSAVHLSTNARATPLGIDTPPEFAWQLAADRAAVVQTGYTIEVSTDTTFGQDVIWRTGHVPSAEPFGVRYEGPELVSMTRYYWRVRIAATAGGEPEVGQWSEPSWFETAILEPELWQAKWITGLPPASKKDDPVLYFRGSVDLGAHVVRARAYVSALGWYRFFVNGEDLTGDALVPRWTPYSEVVEYQTYDVTEALRVGTNLIAVAVGDGRYRGSLGLLGGRSKYGDRIGAFAQLVVELDDGSTITSISDEAWFAGPGRITGSDPKNGERADLRIPDADWLTDTAVPARFAPIELMPDQRHHLIAEEVGRVRDVTRLRCASVSRAPSGAQILDIGQNCAGTVRIRLTGPSGRTVRLTHSEVLTPAGELDAEYIQMGPKWYQRDVVILDGDEHWYQPWFTIHGFRYVEVEGVDHDIHPDDVEALVLSSDLEVTGSFECSEPRLNQLYHNVFWSLRSNFTDTPTDCPTRERSGWTGDIQVFAPAAAAMVDVQAYLRRYLRNLTLEQYADGRVPIYIPSEQPTSASIGRRFLYVVAGSVGWGDAAVLLPWTLYRYYGDPSVLEAQYPSMTAWVDQLAGRARTKRSVRRRLRGRGSQVERFIVDTGFHFGEWLRPDTSPMANFVDGVLRSSAIATAYLEHSARTMSKAAAVLGRDIDADRYRDLADNVRAAWRAAFVRTDGRIGTDRQDDYVRALAFGLLDPSEMTSAVERLVSLIDQADGHLGTGFLSTVLLLPVLVQGGRPDVACRLLMQSSNPSWLHQIERGATTVWETWEGYDDKGNAKDSHNHYALGAVAGFLTEYVAGLSAASPGYRVIDIDPVIGGGLTHARAVLETPYGTAVSSWRVGGDGVIRLEVTVPPGAAARVHLGDDIHEVQSGRHVFTSK